MVYFCPAAPLRAPRRRIIKKVCFSPMEQIYYTYTFRMISKECTAMIHLFPKIRNRMLLISVCYIVLIGVYMTLNPAVNALFLLLLTMIGLAVIMLSHYMNAANDNSRLLARLYNQLDVEGFLREYEPKLKLTVKNPNVALSVRLHISNAYCALGRFDDAIALLEAFVPVPSRKKENDLLARFVVVSNLCYCAEQKEDLESAKRHLDELLALKAQLEALQKAKPEKKRMVFNTELNEQCYAYLTTGKVDVELLKRLVQQNTQQLHKITISLWIARAYLADNTRREAVKLLEKIARLAPELYPSKTAAKLLATLQ